MSFLDNFSDSLEADRKRNPRPAGTLEFMGFIPLNANDPLGLGGLALIMRSQDGQYWERNNLNGAYYPITAPKRVYAPDEVTGCVMHNFHLIGHLPERACRWWEDEQGRILSYQDKLVEGWMQSRRDALRTIVDCIQGGVTSMKEVERAVAKVAQSSVNTIDCRFQPTESSLRSLARRINEGVPRADTPAWEWKDGDNYNKYWRESQYVRGYCPQCGGLEIVLEAQHYIQEGQGHMLRLERHDVALADPNWMPSEVVEEVVDPTLLELHPTAKLERYRYVVRYEDKWFPHFRQSAPLCRYCLFEL